MNIYFAYTQHMRHTDRGYGSTPCTYKWSVEKATHQNLSSMSRNTTFSIRNLEHVEQDLEEEDDAGIECHGA